MKAIGLRSAPESVEILIGRKLMLVQTAEFVPEFLLLKDLAHHARFALKENCITMGIASQLALSRRPHGLHNANRSNLQPSGNLLEQHSLSPCPQL
jgi:hypothetical protein